MGEAWASGDAYGPYVGRWSRLVAPDFLDWLAAPHRSRWLDVGCGTGALTTAILDRCDPATVVGLDLSEGYVTWAAAHVQDPRARFEVGDAADLPADEADMVVSRLALHFPSDPAAAVASMRAAAPDGVVAAYVWDYAGRMELVRHFWDAAVALDPAAGGLDEGVRFPRCRPEPLEALWRGAGLAGVRSRAIDVPTLFRDFDDYWRPFLGGQGPAPGYATSLDEERRTTLRERIRAALPIAEGGSIGLVARAWAVQGRSR
jgi:SAM-dependent methyltransferase